MKHKTDELILKTLEEEFRNSFNQERDKLRLEARKNILKIQKENRQTYNRSRKPPTTYRVNDLVAIQELNLELD